MTPRKAIRLQVVALCLTFHLLGRTHTQSSVSEAQASPGESPRQKRTDSTYSILLPEQKRLVDDYVTRYSATAGTKAVPQEAYDAARVSIRTTFDAVTHALLRVKLTDANRKSLGRAIDLVNSVDEVMGEDARAEGDRQFRLYVYLKPDAVDTLSKSLEFFHDRDNTSYHKGFPNCYRLKNGPPAIQFSISRDAKMADIDVDYRSSRLPAALLNGHLSASNSDVRAGNNLQRHENRWAGLNGWWREVFGSFRGGQKGPKEEPVQSANQVPVNPGVKAKEGIDKSAHDFLKTWVLDKQPNLSLAYVSRLSYPCLETMGKTNPKLGIVRLQTLLAMKKFSDSLGTVNSVGEVFEAAGSWSEELKEAKNAYQTEFRLVEVPADMAADEACVDVSDDAPAKQSREKYYATAFRGKKGNGRDKVMSLLWAQERDYWKIVAIRLEDGGGAHIVPTKGVTHVEPARAELKTVAADPVVVKNITEFYRSWLVNRDSVRASAFVSEHSYLCLAAPTGDDKNLSPELRIRAVLDRPLSRVPTRTELPDLMSGVQPVNELLPPVEHDNAKSFAIMAVPNQKADTFLCQNRLSKEEWPELKPSEAQYGAFYLSASQLNYAEEKSPALLLLWTREESLWKIVAWAVEVP